MNFTLPLVLLLASQVAPAQQPALKTAVPNEAAQKIALTVISDVYKPDYERAKAPAQKVELAKKLLVEGIATKDDTASRFVLFRIARDIASQQGDLKTAFEAIDRIGTEFDADVLQLKVDAATLAVKALKTPKDHQKSATLLFPQIDESIFADRYDLAKSFGSLTLVCARDGRDSDQIKSTALKAKEVEEITAAFEKVKHSKIVLDTKPTDSAANFAVGSFNCFVKGDWKRGVTMLALGDNEEIKAAALLELEATPDLLRVGDAWSKISENLNGLAKTRTQAYAAEWYRKALPGLSGLTRARVEKQLTAFPAEKLGESAGTSVDLLAEIDVKRDTVAGDWKKADGALFSLKGNPALISIPHAVPSEYDLLIEVERIKGSDTFAVGLVSSKGQFIVSLDSNTVGGRISGLEFIDGLPAFKNETVKKGPLFKNEPVKINCRIRRTGITIECDGQQIVQFTGNLGRLSAGRSWKGPKENQFFIGSWETEHRITSIRLFTIKD
jgi:hypothetical protein